MSKIYYFFNNINEYFEENINEDSTDNTDTTDDVIINDISNNISNTTDTTETTNSTETTEDKIIKDTVNAISEASPVGGKYKRVRGTRILKNRLNKN